MRYDKKLKDGVEHPWMERLLLEYIEDHPDNKPSNDGPASPHYFDTVSSMAKYITGKWDNTLPFPFPVPIFENTDQLIDAARSMPPKAPFAEVNLGDVYNYAGVQPIFQCDHLSDAVKIFYRLESIRFSCKYNTVSIDGQGRPQISSNSLNYTLTLGWHGQQNTESWSMDDWNEEMMPWDEEAFAAKIAPRREVVRFVNEGGGINVYTAFYYWRHPAYSFYTAPNIQYGNQPSAMPNITICGVVKIKGGPYYILGSPYITGALAHYDGREGATLGWGQSGEFVNGWITDERFLISENVYGVFSSIHYRYDIPGSSGKVDYTAFTNPEMEMLYFPTHISIFA